MATYAEQLAEINTAISEILTRGQSVSVNDSAKERARLDPLLKERRRLEPLVAREVRGSGPLMRQAVPRG